MKKSIGLMAYSVLMAFLLVNYELEFSLLPLWLQSLIILGGLLPGFYLSILVIVDWRESKYLNGKKRHDSR